MVIRRRRFILSRVMSALMVAFIALITTRVTQAQGEPTTIIDAAYRDLSQQLGVTIIRGGSPRQPTTYSWTDEAYADASLDCAAAGMTYTQGPVVGYRILINYGGKAYDYRAKSDGSIVFQCTTDKRAPGGQAVLPTSASIPSNSSSSNTNNTGSTQGGSANNTLPQVGNAPLLMHIKGDTWTLRNQEIVQRTEWGYNQPGVISPDGTTIAYASSAALAVNLIKLGQLVHSTGDPTNIWVLDIASSTARRIIDQPTGAAIPGNYVIRSQPAWSPDSQSLAWTELPVTNSTAGDYRLVIYSRASEASSVLIPKLQGIAPQGTFAPMTVQWGRGGLATLAATSTAGVAAGSKIVVYDVQGKLISQSEDLQGITNIVWISDDSKEYVAAIPADPKLRWKVVDPQTGKVSDMEGVPELYSLRGNGEMVIYPMYSEGQAAQWVITLTAKNNARLLASLADPAAVLTSLALSPEGTQAASVGGTGIVIIDPTGRSTLITGHDPTAVVWGATGWRIRKE